jgi:hypothetical protein
VYGTEALLLQPSALPSQIYAYLKSKQIDYEALEKSARQWATRPAAAAAAAVPSAAAIAPTPAQHVASSVPGAAPVPAHPPPEEADLPPGWATAKDPQGRVYYWHRETKEVTWQKPHASEGPGKIAANGTEAGGPADASTHENGAAGP